MKKISFSLILISVGSRKLQKQNSIEYAFNHEYLEERDVINETNELTEEII